VIDFGPIDDMIKDETITEIMVNGNDHIYFEKSGLIIRSEKAFKNNEIYILIENILKPLEKQITPQSPYVDTRLEDGSRVNIIIPPVSVTGPVITIRKFSTNILLSEDLISQNALSNNMAEFLKLCVETKQNIVVSGGTGTGKTTLLNILSSFIPKNERIITIEDIVELKFNQEHLCRLEAQPADANGKGAITIRQLLINSLRMRPDRIIIGECRGGEALDMLQALNTGHRGSMTTVHANSSRDCLKRIELMVMTAGLELTAKAIRELVAAAVDIIVQTSRLSDGTRKIINISEVTGLEGETITLAPIFEFQQRIADKSNGKILGEFKGTNCIPTFISDIREKGTSVNMDIFK